MEGYSTHPGSDPARWAKLQTEAKSSPRDLVTYYDKKVEEFLLEAFAKKFPGENITGEESAAKLGIKGNDLVRTELEKHSEIWVIDPIDGTTNFAKAYPFFSVTACQLQKVGNKVEPILCATMNPLTQEIFWAEKDKGAYLNRHKLAVSPTKEPLQSLLTTGFASSRSVSNSKPFELFERITKETLGVRRDGSAALDLAFVSAGRVEGYWEWSLAPWDIAAGGLLVREAGGEVTNLDGSSWDILTGEVLSSNGFLHPWLVKQLKE